MHSNALSRFPLQGQPELIDTADIVERFVSVVVEDDLGLPEVIAETDEDDALVVADCVNPSGEAHLETVVLDSQLAAGVGAVFVHLS